jgi:hypothetical protein
VNVPVLDQTAQAEEEHPVLEGELQANDLPAAVGEKFPLGPLDRRPDQLPQGRGQGFPQERLLLPAQELFRRRVHEEHVTLEVENQDPLSEVLQDGVEMLPLRQELLDNLARAGRLEAPCRILRPLTATGLQPCQDAQELLDHVGRRPLGQIAVRPQFVQRGGRLRRRGGENDDPGHLESRIRLHIPAQADAVQLRHDEVEDQVVRPGGLHLFPGLDAVGGEAHLIAPLGQRFG